LTLNFFVVHRVSRDQNRYQILAKSSNSRLSYWQFSNFSPSYVTLWPWPSTTWREKRFSKWNGPNYAKCGQNNYWRSFPEFRYGL